MIFPPKLRFKKHQNIKPNVTIKKTKTSNEIIDISVYDEIVNLVEDDEKTINLVEDDEKTINLVEDDEKTINLVEEKSLKMKHPKIYDFNHGIMGESNKNSSTGLYRFSKKEFENFYCDNGKTYYRELNKIKIVQSKTNKSFNICMSSLLLNHGCIDSSIKHITKDESKNFFKEKRCKNVNYFDDLTFDLDNLLDEDDPPCNIDKVKGDKNRGLR